MTAQPPRFEFFCFEEVAGSARATLVTGRLASTLTAGAGLLFLATVDAGLLLLAATLAVGGFLAAARVGLDLVAGFATATEAG